LESYLKNFLSNKNWVNKIILLNENSKFFILKHTNIDELTKGLNDNKLQYINIDMRNT
jgi:hypothetical protein